MKNVGYPSSNMKDKGGYGSSANNPNYKNEVNLSQYLTDGATSLGIDCSGLARIVFNSDKEKLMPNFGIIRAEAMRQKFSDAKGTGELRTDFANISQGNLIFNLNKKGEASHVMIATGEMKEQNGTIKVEVVHAPATGKYVETTWVTVKEGWTYGHTFRTTDKNAENEQETNVRGDQYNSIIYAMPNPTFTDRVGNHLLESKAPIIQDVGTAIKSVGRFINKLFN